MRTQAGRDTAEGGGADIDDAPHEVSDEELTELALAADPDSPVGDDATSFFDVAGPGAGGLLPEWYMPGGAGPGRVTGWRRSVALVIVAAFLLITAYGLCNTYGD